MRPLLLALMLASGSHADAVTPIRLEIDGVRRGAFAGMEHPRNAGPTVILTDGWIDEDLFGIWGFRDARLLEPGKHRPEPDLCQGRRLTIRQVFGDGLRQNGRSWTLLDACPVAWEIEATDDEEGRLRVRRFTLTIGEVGASR